MWRYLVEVLLLGLALAAAVFATAVLQYFGKPANKTKFTTWSFVLFVAGELLCMWHYDAGIVQLTLRGVKQIVAGPAVASGDGSGVTGTGAQGGDGTISGAGTGISGSGVTEIEALDLRAKNIALDYWRNHTKRFDGTPDWKVVEDDERGAGRLADCRLIWTDDNDVGFQLQFLINSELWRNYLTHHPSVLSITDYRLEKFGGKANAQVRFSAWVIANSDRIVRRYIDDPSRYSPSAIKGEVLSFFPGTTQLNEHLLNDSDVQLVFLVKGEFVHYMIPANGMRQAFASVTRCTNKLPYSSGSGAGWKST
jgi:hypothetical protein